MLESLFRGNEAFFLGPGHGTAYSPSRNPDRLQANCRPSRPERLLAYYETGRSWLWGNQERKRVTKGIYRFPKKDT